MLKKGRTESKEFSERSLETNKNHSQVKPKAKKNMNDNMAKGLKSLGWREWVSLPGLGVKEIKGKVDTGARTSALHAENIKYFKKGKREMVRFTIFPDQRSSRKQVVAEAQVLEKREVRSSDGQVTVRPVIVTELKIGKEIWPIELTLVNRDLMGFRMLIGRQAIRNRYIVDPGRSFLAIKATGERFKRGE